MDSCIELLGSMMSARCRGPVAAAASAGAPASSALTCRAALAGRLARSRIVHSHRLGVGALQYSLHLKIAE